MKKNLTYWMALTLFLFGFSLTTFYFDTKRGIDLVEGSELISTMNIEKVSKIIVEGPLNEKVILNRNGNAFLISSDQNFPADSQRVNDFVYNISSIEISQRITSNPSKWKNYEVDESHFKKRISFYDSKSKELYQVLVGKKHKMRGHFVRLKSDQSVYLSRYPVKVQTKSVAYYNNHIINLEESEIKNLKVKGKRGNQIFTKKQENWFVGKNQRIKEAYKKNLKDFFNKFKRVHFVRFYSSLHDLSQQLSFQKEIEVTKKNQLGYKIQLAHHDKKSFIKVLSVVEEIPSEIALREGDEKTKLQDIENVVRAQEMAEKFNFKHSNWIYEIAGPLADSIRSL